MALEQWNIDPVHSGIQFVVRHMVVSKVRGSFTRFGGSILVDEDDPAASSVEVRVEAASVDTREPKRDSHLRSADFFDVEKYPEIVFRSTEVEPGDGPTMRIRGDLTLHGVTRPVTLEAEGLGREKDPWGGERAGFSARASINRRDFGLEWNQVLESGGVVVGEKIELELEVEAVKAQPAAVAA